MEEAKKTESPPSEVVEPETEEASSPMQPMREAPTGEDHKDETLIADAMEEEDDSSEEYSLEEFGDPMQMSANDRLSVYEKGKEYLGKGKKVMALKCFLRCLKGLQQSNTFQPLPQCLRVIADIYYSKGEIDKAVHFVQAEKLFYETALIDASEWERKTLDENPKESSTEISEIHRAQDYENLAKICLEKKQPQLALEYQAKATKIRQQTLGDDHPVTAESLDLFTVIYGEVGKKQYSESMEKLENAVDRKSTKTDGLRQRKVPQQTSERSSEGHPTDAEVKEQEMWISHSLLWVLLLLCLIMLIALLTYAYCQYDVKNRSRDGFIFQLLQDIYKCFFNYVSV